MTYQQDDWEKACRRLAHARELYNAYQLQDKKTRTTDDLDRAILDCWSFGEYAVNVALECRKLKPVQNHTQPQEARDLYRSGDLAQDYHDTLERLERFRKKASHLGYVKDRSTHYSSADLERCISHLESLQAEVAELLRTSPP